MLKKATGDQSQPWRETRGWLASVPDLDALFSSSREPYLFLLFIHAGGNLGGTSRGQGSIADARGLLWANSRAGNKRGLQ